MRQMINLQECLEYQCLDLCQQRTLACPQEDEGVPGTSHLRSTLEGEKKNRKITLTFCLNCWDNCHNTGFPRFCGMYNRQYMSLSDQNAVSTITWHALKPQLVSHQNLKVNSVKKSTRWGFSGANLCTDMTHVPTLYGLLILWFMGTLKNQSRVLWIQSSKTLSHAVGGARASWNGAHV